MSSPVSFPPTPDLYQPFYGHELLGIAASGGEISGKEGRALFRSIQELVARNISVLLTYGEMFPDFPGAYQRETKDEILKGLRNVLPDDCPIDDISPEHVVCTFKPDDCKLVGTPIRVDRDITAPVTIVGYYGVVDGRVVPVRKDDIAKILAPRTVENFLVTRTGGVVENSSDPPEKQGAVSVMFADEIDEDGGYRNFDIDGDKRKILRNAKAMADDARIVIAAGGDIPGEIFNVGGKGTLVVQRRNIVVGHPTAPEREIVKFVIEQNERAGNFRPRTEAERALALRHHLVLREHTPLAGCSLVPFEDGSMELSTLWSGYNGMGKILAEEAKRYFLSRSDCRLLFALSQLDNPKGEIAQDETVQRFQRYGFRFIGPLSDVKAKQGVPVPPHLKTYDTDARNPCLFVATREELSQRG